MVYIELLKINTKVSYWKGKKEVDFVVQNGHIELLNVSYTDDLQSREIDGLVEGLQEFNLEEGVILTKNHFATTEVQGKIIKCIPLWVWLLFRSKQSTPEGIMPLPIE